MKNKGYKMHNIEDLKSFALLKQGECLSSSYSRNDHKYLWKCKVISHKVFEARWDNVKRGRWCKECAHESQRIDFKFISEKIKEFGGELITQEKEYINSKSIIQYHCENGHLCNNDWNRLQKVRIQKGGSKLHWCSSCSNKKKYTLEEVRKVFLDRKGLLISESYKSNKKLLSAICNNGHEFTTNLHNVLQGQWCRQCSSGRGEQYTRFIFEKITGVKFPSQFPKWLSGLQLDGYNETLKIAFEYHGVQHYRYTPIFHNNDITQFENQKNRDQKKRELCLKNGVHLVEIDGYSISKKDLYNQIYKRLKDLNLELVHIENVDQEFYNHFYPDEIKNLETIANNKNGKCISSMYKGESSPLEFECEFGHRFRKKPSSIKKGIWCPEEGCNLKARATEKVKKYVEVRGGYLVTTYQNNRTQLEFFCDKGHSNITTWASLRKSWCSTCAKNKRGTIEEMQDIAKSKGGICISEEYGGVDKRLLWSCSNVNHLPWYATPGNIKPTQSKKGSWCPDCARENRRVHK